MLASFMKHLLGKSLLVNSLYIASRSVVDSGLIWYNEFAKESNAD